MKITRSKFVGACHECGEAARNHIEFYWAGLTVRLCDKHMLQPRPSSNTVSTKRVVEMIEDRKKNPKPKRTVY